MTPDELLTHLEAELARCRDERDALRAELEGAVVARDQAVARSVRAERTQMAAENERDRLYGELHSLLGSRSWQLTRPLRRAMGSDRPEAAEPG